VKQNWYEKQSGSKTLSRIEKKKASDENYYYFCIPLILQIRQEQKREKSLMAWRKLNDR
jgi:hypothetical protein